MAMSAFLHLGPTLASYPIRDQYSLGHKKLNQPQKITENRTTSCSPKLNSLQCLTISEIMLRIK